MRDSGDSFCQNKWKHGGANQKAPIASCHSFFVMWSTGGSEILAAGWAAPNHWERNTRDGSNPWRDTKSIMAGIKSTLFVCLHYGEQRSFEIDYWVRLCVRLHVSLLISLAHLHGGVLYWCTCHTMQPSSQGCLLSGVFVSEYYVTFIGSNQTEIGLMGVSHCTTYLLKNDHPRPFFNK